MTRDRYESLEYDGKLYSEIQHLESGNDDLKKQVKELQQENKQLEDLLHKANDEVISYTNCCIDLKEKIDKTIEFNKSILKQSWYGGNEKEYAKTNLEILGEKENES